MRVTIATPLFPPDVAEPAPYVKELAERLSRDNHVTVLMYGHLPEYVERATYVCVDKRAPLFQRLYRFTHAMHGATRNADILYALNGPSVELPLLIFSFFNRIPIVFLIGDSRAHIRAIKHWHLRILHKLVSRRTRAVVDRIPLGKPEVLPFGPKPDAALAGYERAWAAHLLTIRNIP